MSVFSRLALGFATGALVLVGAAEAHPRLIGSSPANGAAATNVRAVQLRFSEALIPAFSSAEVLMTGMPGMASHRPMRIPAQSAVQKDGRTLLLAARTPLRPGTYRVNWRVVSKDTHRMTGSLSFAVR